MPTVPHDPDQPAGPPARHLQPGDGWVECDCGGRHWGLFGAAGLMLVRRTAGEVVSVVLQHRAVWSDQGGTWALPGGARNPDESAEAGALREAREEAGIDADDIVVLGTSVVDHGAWSYTTVIAQETPGADVVPAVTDAESIDVRWVPVDDVARLPLLAAFAAAWPGLRARLETDPEG
nr:NUDIX hydrolase [Paraoerskovia sediminicola]